YSSILIQLNAEQTLSNKAVTKRIHRLERNKPLNSFEYFLSESIICLGMAKRFYKWNKKSHAIYGLLIRNMDIYTRLKNKLNEILYNQNQLFKRRNIYDSNFIIITTDDMIFENGVVVNMDINNIMEFEEDELIDFYTWVNKIPDRIGWMVAMEAMIDQIQTAFFKICSSLYRVLNEYCMKLRQYLFSNKDTLKSSKFYSKNPIRHRYCYMCCKYHFLKRLLEVVGEEEKYIVKYDATCKENR
ncbi:uncharacterized protein, partial [Polyergus mexicanus]|uniref:uncharacterized protein n=1 Tax=Polyergus mexicanus TaxID=615972 RepID=UPI0038B5ED2E